MKHLFFLLFLYSSTLFAQQEGSKLLSSNNFTSREGYLISKPFDAKYDSDGWLWILGESRDSNPYLFSDKEIVIQRFDGANFFTLKIPNTSDKEIKDGLFFKHEKGLYLKLFYKDSKAQLFHIDTQTLKFSPVNAYNTLKKEFIVSKEYQVGDTTRLLITSKNKLYSAAIDHLQLKFIDSIAIDQPVERPFLSNVVSTDQFSIVKLVVNEEFLLLDSQGKLIKILSEGDFISKDGKTIYPNEIQKFLKVNGQDFYYLEGYENVFKYQSGKFSEVPKTDEYNQLNRDLIFNADFTKAYTIKKVGDYSEFKLYDFNDLKPEVLATIDFKNFSKIAYRKLGQDLVVLDGEKLSVYIFNNTRFKTFLKGKSVRAVQQLPDSTYMVSTVNEGFYVIDVASDTAQKVDVSSNGKKISINQASDIFIEKDKIITGNQNNLYTLNSSFEIIKNQTLNIPAEEMIRIKDTIFTTGQGGVIYKYSNNENKYAKIPNTGNLQVKEFATDGKTLYATTSLGLFEYINGIVKIYSFENAAAENLLSIHYSDSYGVLVSTKLGELYRFNTTTKKLDFIYDDQFNAAIVGMVEDDNYNLWLNTHAGIVSFNLSTKKIVRYGLKEGLYELKGNQHSSYKDSQGNIFMGSSKGLSFFNLRNLSKNNSIDVQPKFSSISFFNSEEDRWEMHTSPQFLKTTEEIVLPSEYRRFSVHTSVFESLNPENVNYRFRLLSEEIESEWYATYPGKELLYANLAPGRYTLQIEALDTSNNKLGETLELTVISEQVFYKTWWFIILLLLAVIGILVYLFHQYQIKQRLFAKNEIALNEASVKNNMMLEIHHRIKNNLQIISGFLEMQMADSDDEFLKSVLENSQGRIESIAGIHDLLYNTENENNVVVKENVERIISYYKKLFLFDIEYDVDIDSSIMSIDQITPFSILFNELISNSNKHAFEKIENPIITIRFHKKENRYVFEYFDNGNFKIESTKANTMGMKIVSMMNKQLKGTLEIEKDNHFHLTMFFPING
ncbi:histidine kinase dimerization/phosphoacceptor domain -containing protein [Nonlabens marinus]|uniref:histidine kinase dimerization/phosphoacceptor domain -containing protein n=1 Tax=Nonlabens marinus TaxID=930802 RepID=UPI00130DCE09|nr:histidine kinase dimerization/phosphoacceptor domain -containing protein [Nonlabens marinus]